jgi:hypothetical protein
LNAVPHLLDEPRRERLVDQRSQPGVVGRVLAEHVALQRFEQLAEPRLSGELGRRQGVGLVLDEALVLQNRDRVVVASDEPGRLVRRQDRAVDWRFGPQPGVEGERVRLEFRTGDVYRVVRR